MSARRGVEMDLWNNKSHGIKWESNDILTHVARPNLFTIQNVIHSIIESKIPNLKLVF